jgi:3-hydroxyisobutyrate dehydrogenase-like beta-hydroxyacid dehydrogenase
MAHVAFLGTGLIGSKMIERQRALGADVIAWNRTRSKAEALVRLGVRVADTPADAVRGAERVHIVLTDDAAVDEVLAAADGALSKADLVIDHSTTSPKLTAERATRLAARDLRFLHAPIFMSPQAAQNGAGVMMVAGPAPIVDFAQGALAKMTGDVWYVGERLDLAASYKLFGNAMIFALCAGLSDVFALGKSLGVKPTDVHRLFSRFNVAAVLEYRGRAMAEGNFAPAFELTMARKDLRLMVESAAPHADLLTVLPTLVNRFDELIEQGHGKKDLGVIAIDAVGGR